MNRETIASYIDHTLLKPDADISHIKAHCEDALTYGFHAICTYPFLIKSASQILKNSKVKICSVAGFPLGTNSSDSKLSEIENCLKHGANEIDMVMNIGLFKIGNYRVVEHEITEAKKMIEQNVLKIIIETSALTKNEIVSASKLAEGSGANYIKTSTGFHTEGASEKNIQLIKKSIKPKTRIKASGGIKSLKQVKKMLNAGADRIGTSSGIIIMKEIPLN